jgi:TRAP-type C4-dicarboxylate transport system permease small subunit
VTILATSLIDWSALWRIVTAALIGGAGVTIVFGVLLLCLRYARGAHSDGSKVLGWSLAAVCGVLCVGAAVIGIIAMADKPASKAKKAHKTAAALVRRERQGRLVA